MALGASGGKDSTVLAHIISLLNKRHEYDLFYAMIAVCNPFERLANQSMHEQLRTKAVVAIN